VSEWSARIPSALAALVVLLLTLRLGSRLFGSAAIGAGGAMILLTGIEFFQKAEWVSCDMLMTAGAFVALTAWREVLFEEASAVGLVLGWTAVAAAVLSKGPVGLLWPTFWIVSEAAARKRFRPLLRALHPIGIAVFVTLVGGWLFAFGSHAGMSYLEEAVFKQNLTRYVSAWNSVHPWYFYFSQLPFDLLPWSPLLPAAIALAVPRVSRCSRRRGCERAPCARALLP
jgi:4-amino-4-deoxy-L-arabinose transferase-like glycosyltransferase